MMVIEKPKIEYSVEDLKTLCRCYSVTDSVIIGEEEYVSYPLLGIFSSVDWDIDLFYEQLYKGMRKGNALFYGWFYTAIATTFTQIPLKVVKADGLIKAVLQCRLQIGK